MDSYKKNKGNAGLEGVQFQLDLLILSFLNALQNLKNWKVSTEDKEAGKYDDIVIKLSDESAILVQAKHKAKKNVTKEQLLSTNSKNSDFSLPKFFFSHLEIKKKIKEKTLIVCTNTDIDQKGLGNILTPHIVPSNHILHYEDSSQSFFTFNDDILTDLKASAEVYLDKNLQGRGINKAVINEENLKDFLKDLQIFPNYPSESKLHEIIEGVLSRLGDISLCRTISYHEIYRKVEEWFKQPKGEYLTEIRAKAMFCEIKSDKYCKSLKDYQISFENNHFNFTNSNSVFHIIGEGRYLMQMLKIYCSLHHAKSRKLYVNPDDGTELQKQVVEAFQLQRYTFLIIIGARFLEESVISNKLRDILERDPYKKLILVADGRSTLTQQIGLKDVLQVDGSVTFEDLSKESQQKLLKNENILFQGKIVSLEKLLHTQASEGYAKSLNSTMLAQLIEGEQIKVGAYLNPDEDITPYYINRTFERKINRKEQLMYSFPEERIYELNEKLILISDCAGMGKSTFLSRLALSAKEKTPHLWVIKIILNDYTRILRDSLRKNKQTLDLTELLNSQETTKLKNDFEQLVFSINGKVLLLVDGVDEISPDYTALVISLLEQCQKRPNFAKIFVTTRPHLSQDLEERLNVESIKILPFTSENQKNFLTSYWAYNLQLNDTAKNKCDWYAITLITKMFSWIKSHYYKENPFTAIPLQVSMLAEIFQENIKSKELVDWEGCKEYLNSNESEPNLPEKINIARLYNMFIDKKQDIFVDKSNPDGNTAANRALLILFEDCLAYHRTLAWQEILSQRNYDFFFCRRLDCKYMEEYMLKIGIVQKSDDQFQFIHRTFAEYFAADSITKELQLQNKNVEFQKFLIDEVLMTNEFEVVRTFLDCFLQKIVDSLPCNIFESYQSVVTYESSGKNIIFLLASEGLVAILQLVLKSVQFEIVKGKEVKVTHLSTEYGRKRNTLNDLQILVHEGGVNIKHENGMTPLHNAVWGNHLDMINFLVKHGADVNSIYHNGKTALHLVVERYRQVDSVKLLVELGVNINIVDDNGRTAAFIAAETRNFPVLNYLVESGTHINVKAYQSCAVLHLVAEWGRFDAIKCLVTHGADINVRNADGNTALHLAANKRKWVAVMYLAECGIDVNLRDSKGCTPLHLAAESGDLKTVKCLVKFGADVNMKNNDGNTALHIATLNSEFETAIYLIEQGADMNSKGNDCRTALHLAVFMGTLNTTKYLVEHGADLTVTDNVGNTALHLAAFRGRLDTVKYLIECGLDVNVTDNYGSTTLHLAAFDGNLDNIEYLVERGVCVNARDKNGSTVLHLAAFSGRFDTIKYFVEHGADVGITDNNGQTALDVAASNGHLDCVNYLKEVGLGVNC